MNPIRRGIRRLRGRRRRSHLRVEIYMGGRPLGTVPRQALADRKQRLTQALRDRKRRR